jgi:hypothetical protein
MITRHIVDSFAPTATSLSHLESNNDVLSKFEANTFKIDLQKLTKSLEKVHLRDSFEIEVFYKHTEIPSRLTTQSKFEDFIESLGNNAQHVEEGEKFTIKIKIRKCVIDNRKSIYSIADIISYWNAGTPYEALKKLQDLGRSCTELESGDILEPAHTSLFSFLPISTCDNMAGNQANHSQVLQRREKHINFTHGHELLIIPEDLKLTNNHNKDLSTFFRPALALLSLIHIADHTVIDNNLGVEVRLSGYKSISQKITAFSDINEDGAENIFDIYSWVYSESKISDKIGLARNLISIHVKNGDITSIQPGCLSSLHSNYQIYLKENLKQYIETKNKITDAIQKASDKASDMVKQVGTYFRASVFSIYSFFLTIFLLRAINKETLDLHISNSLYMIFIFFLIISVSIFFYAKSEFKQEKKRYINSYASLKSRYTDLIADSDLKIILQNDNDHINDINFIDETFKKTTDLWITLICLMFILVTSLRISSL